AILRHAEGYWDEGGEQHDLPAEQSWGGERFYGADTRGAAGKYEPGCGRGRGGTAGGCADGSASARSLNEFLLPIAAAHGRRLLRLLAEDLVQQPEHRLGVGSPRFSQTLQTKDCLLR